MCRCGTCGRFTSHWADDESFCSNETCWKEDEFGYISPPKALLCENCKEAMTSDNDFFRGNTMAERTYVELEEENSRLTGEVTRLQNILNTPYISNFVQAVKNEAAHQIHSGQHATDEFKTPLDWFWTLGFLAQKAATAQQAGDNKKALHHTISSAALMAHWHQQIMEKMS